MTTENIENIEGFVVDIACLRRYGVADTLERARVHTTKCALMGHCVESGYGLVDDDGRVHLLDTHATRHVVTALQRADRERGVRLSVHREDTDGEQRSVHVAAVEAAERSAHASDAGGARPSQPDNGRPRQRNELSMHTDFDDDGRGPMPNQNADRNSHGDTDKGRSGMQTKMYVRFAAMILTGMVVMYWVMFVGSWEWSHVRWSQSRMFMALTMGGTMGLVMLAWMLNMYRKTAANIIVVGVSVLLLVVGIVLDRSQATVDDTAFMKAMIPHHSLAITRSERFDNDDVRVCELAVAISEAQRREILEMDWLIEDIRQNGVASTPEQADARPVPDFDRTALRDCATD